MAGGVERVLRRRIKSVASTKKITRAMELIAASRIVKAQARLHAARPYAEKITEVLANLTEASGSVQHPLLRKPESLSARALVVVTADRGLCGGYNAGVLRLAEAQVRADAAAGISTKLICVGKKGVSYFRFKGLSADATFFGFSDNPTYDDARKVAEHVTGMFERSEVDAIDLVYTQFFSVATQRPTIRPFLPLVSAELNVLESALDLSSDVISEMRSGGEAAVVHERVAVVKQADLPSAGYDFEPSADVLIDRLLPRYVESRFFAVLLDSAASEHAARQRAMKSATDNADELGKSLTRIMNRARQESITTEIMEIVSGAEALSDDVDEPFYKFVGHTTHEREALARARGTRHED
jgi:F-type H+-transporting ATPase subunit gamma